MITPNIKQNIQTKLAIGAALFMVASLLLPLLNSVAGAASLQNSSVRLDRMAAATASSVRVTFTVPAGNSATEDKLLVTFPAGFTVATAGLTSSTVSCGATALPGTLVLTGNNTTKTITVSGVTNLTAATSYCVDLTKTDTVTNPGAGQYTVDLATQDSGSSTVDSTEVAVAVISNDQITVSAVVPPSFSFTIDANSTAFTSDLDAGAVRATTGRTVTITTNASKGWTVWAKDSNAGLNSAAAGKTIASRTPGTAATLSAGTEGYVLGVTRVDATGGGTVNVTSAYDGTVAAAGSGLDTTYRQVASSNGTAGGSGDVLTLTGKATVASDTPSATDYSDIWTVVGAGTY